MVFKWGASPVVFHHCNLYFYRARHVCRGSVNEIQQTRVLQRRPDILLFEPENQGLTCLRRPPQTCPGFINHSAVQYYQINSATIPHPWDSDMIYL